MIEAVCIDDFVTDLFLITDNFDVIVLPFTVFNLTLSAPEFKLRNLHFPRSS